MSTASDIYRQCDILEQLPRLHRENWLWELNWLAQHLPQSASILQVGCMDGTRLIRLLQKRPDLCCSGLDIDNALLSIARQNFLEAGVSVDLIHADIVGFEQKNSTKKFDAVLCLNNTLGYISQWSAALKNMKTLGKETIVSVYGENFTDQLAREYFSILGLTVEETSRSTLRLNNGWLVRRFTAADVREWGEVIETPLGYCCIMPAQ